MSGRPQAGVALAIVMVLLVVTSLLGAAGLATAALDLRMAENDADRQRAFDAAEVAIAEALRSPDLSNAWTYTRPKSVGPIALATSAGDAWNYRLWYDTEADPIEADDRNAGLRAHHFVVEATGRAGRGATVTLVQGFYVLTPSPAPAVLSPPCTGDCVDGGPFGPRRTYWLHTGAE